MWRGLLIAALAGALLYGLYRQGWLAIRSKRAAAFMGDLRGNKASFTGCTGVLRRLIPCREDGPVPMGLEVKLTKGAMTAEVYNRERQLVLRLDPETPSGSFDGRRGERYILILRFAGASGAYRLHIGQG